MLVDIHTRSQRKEAEKMAQEEGTELPEECWEIIFNHFNHSSHWQAVSFTCRQFLSISNRIRPSIAISGACFGLPGGLARILHRFQGLKEIDLSNFHGNLARPLGAIAQVCPHLHYLSFQGQKGLPLEAILELGRCCIHLKGLNCSRLHLLQDDDVKAIAVAFPQLERIDISYPQLGFRPLHGFTFPADASLYPGTVTDTGIEAMAAGLVHLRSVNISGNYLLSDFSLQALAMGCQELVEISVFDCPFVTDTGLELLGRHCHNLGALAINGPRVSSPGIEGFLSHTRSLSSLDLSNMTVTDELFSRLGELQVPLKKLVLARCKGLTSAALLSLASGCPQITHLNLEGAHCLKDKNISALARKLPNLCIICLNYCSMLTDSSFFCLLESCSRLEELDMESTGLGWGMVKVNSCKTCFHLRSLKLAWNKPVGDVTLQLIGRLCPSLVSLDLSHCMEVSDVGLGAISHGCPRVRELSLKGCRKVHSLGGDGNFDVLEQLELEVSGITNSGLQNVARNCRHLMSLGLRGCVQITDSGLKKLMEDCKELKEINLKDCQGVNIDALAWMVFDRPSLRKLVLPFSGVTEAQKRRLMRHGCELSSCKAC